MGAQSTYYIVQPEEEAVVKRFGKVIAIKGPGPHFKLPFGIDTATRVPTARLLKEEFGFRSSGVGDRTRYDKDVRHQGESLMLTGDLKVIDVEWVVHYLISDPGRYLHAVKNPTQTIRDISEAGMRRIVGNSLGSDVLTEKRVEVSTKAREELQDALDKFDMGVSISRIELQDVTPPEMVKPAFNEVHQAEQERERLINEADKRRNQVVPRAEGRAAEIDGGTQRSLAEIQSEARREAEIIRGRADAEASRVYSDAFNADPEFYSFLRTLESCSKSLGNQSTLMLGADSDYFRYLRSNQPPKQ
jgi:modulator of FtsH protease HflK